MAEAYKVNGKGFLAVFGAVVIKDGGERESLDSFLQWPDRKSSLTIDREDQDGNLIDLADPKFEVRDFVLKIAFHAANRADFFTKYNGFRTEFTNAATQQLYIADIDLTYEVYYKSQRNLKTLSNIHNDGVWATFELVLSEVNPSQNMPKVFITDNLGRFLITSP